MEKKISIANRQVILNYNKAYPKNREALLKSNTFRKYIEYFIRVEKDMDTVVYSYLTCDDKYSIEEAAVKFCTFLRLLAVFEYHELSEHDITRELSRDRHVLLYVIEEIYRSWRSLQRFAFMDSLNTPDFGINTLDARDSSMND